MKRILLRKGREKPLLKKHPWVFSGAVKEIEGSPDAGDTVAVCDGGGKFLAWAAYSPKSQIIARVWSVNEDDSIGKDFFAVKIKAAIARRERLGFGKNSDEAYRMVYSESDGLPGLIVDRYGRMIVMQVLSTGTERNKDIFTEILKETTACDSIYERSDSESRGLEGLAPSESLLWGSSAPDQIKISEGGCQYYVNIKEGHKTGFYLDQRDNRRAAAEFSTGRRVLDCFSYTGGFTVAALSGGAESVVSVDSSRKCLSLLEENVKLNGFDAGKVETIRADVFERLRGFVAEGRKFGMVILDPPKFAPASENLDRALRAYKDVNMQAMKLLEPGGLLMTFSCSGAVGMDDFSKAAAWAAMDAGCAPVIIRRLGQPPDHPVSLSFPQSEYLKGLVISV